MQQLETSTSSSDDLPTTIVAPAVQAFDWLAKAPVIFGLIVFYLIGHFIIRLNLSPTLGIDDAEQVLFAQHWALSYRFRQPPLFTWLLLPFVDWIGPSVLAISIVRYGLLAVTYGCLYLTALSWIEDRRLAALSVLSFSLIYVFAYYAHHDLTHTTALGAMIAVSLLAFTKLSQKPTILRYLLLGLCFGFGMLAKWNFMMLAIGLPLTCLFSANHRHLVLTWKSLYAIVVMALIISPTALWMFSHGQSVGGLSSDIFGPSTNLDMSVLMIEGGTALLTSIILFLLPFILVFMGIFGTLFASASGDRAQNPKQDTKVAFLFRLTLVILGLHALLIPLFGAVNFTERWMHPALISMPIALFAILERYKPNTRLISIYLATTVILVAVAAGARLYRYAEGADQCGKCREFAPFEILSDDLRLAGFDKGTIVADGMHMGGNLKMAFPDSRLIDPAFPLVLWPPAIEQSEGDGGMCLLVWRADQPDTEARRRALYRFAQDELGMPKTAVGERGHAAAALYNSTTKRYGIEFELILENAGGCR